MSMIAFTELKRVCLQLLRTSEEILRDSQYAGTAEVQRVVHEAREAMGVWNGSYPTPQRLIHLRNITTGLLATLPADSWSVERYALTYLREMLYVVATGYDCVAAGEDIHTMHVKVLTAAHLTSWRSEVVATFVRRREAMMQQSYIALRDAGARAGHPAVHVMGIGTAPRRTKKTWEVVAYATA